MLGDGRVGEGRPPEFKESRDFWMPMGLVMASRKLFCTSKMALMVEIQRSLEARVVAARRKDLSAPGCLSWITKTSSEG